MNFISILKKYNEENNMNLNLIKVQFFMKKQKIRISLFDEDCTNREILEDLNDEISNQLCLSKNLIDLETMNLEEFTSFFLESLSDEMPILSDLSIKDFSFLDKDIFIYLKHDLLIDSLKSSKSYIQFESIVNQSGYSVVMEVREGDEIAKCAVEYENEKLAQIENKIKESAIKEVKKAKIKKVSENLDGLFSYGFKRKDLPNFVEIEHLVEDHNTVLIHGTVYEMDFKEVKNGAFLRFDLDDGNYAVRCKKWVRNEDIDLVAGEFKNGMDIQVVGVYKYDEFDKSQVMDVASIQEIHLDKSLDLNTDKRIEFNIHTKYSNLEGLVDIPDLISTLSRWDHKSFGITDEYNVQAYPEIYKAAKSKGIKVNLGCEFRMLENHPSIITNPYEIYDYDEKDIVVFDIETTGLSRYNDNITEIGAVRLVNGAITDVFQQLVNPEMIIPDFITDLTGISNNMVANEPKIAEVMPRFLEFCQGAVLAAHNADFDIGFIKRKSFEMGIEFKPVYLDTMWLARALNPHLKNHKLNTLTKEYQVRLDNHHRACDDATATAEVLIKMLDQAREQKLKLSQLNDMETDYPTSKNLSYMNLVYVQNKVGLKNMYRNVSFSSVDYLSNVPGLPWGVYEENRDGLLIASGGYRTKLFDLIATGYSDDVIYKEADKFDFFTVEPLGICDYLVSKNYVKDEEHFKSIILKIISIAMDLDKLVVAVGGVYYLDKNDFKYRNILKNYPRKRSIENRGYFYLRNTEEMMKEFDFLDQAVQEDVVIYNGYELDKLIENISPIAEGTFPPVIATAETELKDGSYEKAKSIYGENLPDIVEKRLDKELNSIISNGYATLYIIAKELVKKSNDDGYLVGSRGSVGSSFAATMADITEVNPLEPHYVCPECKHSEFIEDSQYGTGVDLPEKVCPKCGTLMKRDGFDIPFEVFLGFEGDKEPDIDLNFAGVYQPVIHKYTETMFGKRKVFRAGTLGTIADKTAYGMAKKFKEFYPEDTTLKMDPANVDKIKRKIVGVKRTTGQHAGGLIIVPEDKDIEDFTPIQYPADDAKSGIITTHFDYHAIDTNLLKLDLLGHNAPTIVRMLSDDTGLDALKIDLSDPDTMTIFHGTEKLNIKHDYTNIDTGSLGIPEFGTGFVRQMLKDTKPTTFEELVRISGLSHGTDVWLNNAQDLINNGTTVLRNAICTRDDIMNYLISQDMQSKMAFDIMEKVRKGKGLSEAHEAEMKRLGIPQWYIDSCNKIKYMFPRAHAVAYVMMSYRIAYYKVHYPAYFYATYFTNKIADFQYDIISKDLDYLTMYIKEIKASPDFSMDDKYYTLEVAEEMKARDIKLLAPDLYKSHPEKFTVENGDSILPPLMAVDSISQQVALRIAQARREGNFLSVEDFTQRTKTNKNAISAMEEFGMFDGMQNENQMDFFSM